MEPLFSEILMHPVAAEPSLGVNQGTPSKLLTRHVCDDAMTFVARTITKNRQGDKAARERLVRSHLHNFLMAALNGAFALAEVDDIAFSVPKDLHLDVASRLHVLLQEDT